jgi:thiol-disulfide isomerase/thioredoxin
MGGVDLMMGYMFIKCGMRRMNRDGQLRKSDKKRTLNRFILWSALWMAIAGCSGPPDRPPRPALEPIIAPQILSRLTDGTKAVTLVHVWATWCPPCAREFPDVVKLAKAYRERGLRVLLISADSVKDRETVSEFLVAHNVDWPTCQAVNINDDFIKTLSTNWSGAIPASFFFTSDGKLLEEWEGAHPYSAYEEAVLRLVDNPKEGEPGI